MELLIKTGPLFQLFSNTTLFGALGPEGWVEGAVERHGLAFRADPSRHPDTLHECMSEQDAVMPTARPCSRLEVPLDQAGRRSMFYLADGAWHHLAFRKNAVSGEQSIWLDGQCPDGFSHPQPNRSTGKAISQPSGLFTLLSTHFDGAIDEVALFEVALPDAMIAQHYADAMAHKPYSLVLRPPFSAGAPTPAPVAGLMDSREFAPGTICPGWSANCTPSRCNTTAGTSDGYYQGACIECITRGNRSQQDPLEQLRSFPSPRIVPSAQAQFGRHNAWCKSTLSDFLEVLSKAKKELRRQLSVGRRHRFADGVRLVQEPHVSQCGGRPVLQQQQLQDVRDAGRSAVGARQQLVLQL